MLGAPPIVFLFFLIVVCVLLVEVEGALPSAPSSRRRFARVFCCRSVGSLRLREVLDLDCDSAFRVACSFFQLLDSSGAISWV